MTGLLTLSLIRTTYPGASEAVLVQTETLFATWKAHLDSRRAQKLPGRYPSDEALAEMLLDKVPREQSGADDAVKKKR